MLEWCQWAQCGIPVARVAAMSEQIKYADKYYFLLQSKILRKQELDDVQAREIILKLEGYEGEGLVRTIPVQRYWFRFSAV